jgi:NADH:ubiquinone oxidoreductase subunit C
MDINVVKSAIEKALPGTALKLVRDTLLVENPQDLVKVAQFLKTSEFKLDYLSSVTAADYLQFLETVYHFYSMELKSGTPVVLRVRAPKENPKVPSLVPVFRSAEFQEREAFDTYGVVYEGHPDLRRIFMWDGFEGFPMRKDYVQEDSETLEAADVEWLDKHGINVPAEDRAKAEELKKAGKRAVAEKPKPGSEAV